MYGGGPLILFWRPRTSTTRRLSKGGRFCWGARGAPGARGEPPPVRFVRRSTRKYIDYQFYTHTSHDDEAYDKVPAVKVHPRHGIMEEYHG
jgi:hypothetical protein